MTNIREREQSENALRKSEACNHSPNGEARLRAMIEASVDCVITIDAQSTIIEFNAAAEQTFGYRRDDVIGKPLTETIIPPSLREGHRMGMAALLKGGTSKLLGKRVEMPAMRSDGSEFPVELTVTQIAGQTPPIFTAYLRDITERERAEAALRQSEARTRLLIKSSNIGLWDWNLVTNEVFFSPEWKRQLGCSDDELPNHYEKWESRLHPEDREPTLRAVQDFREGRRADYDVEFRLRHKDGSWRSILTRANLIRDAAGQAVRMMGCHIDITSRKQAEEALRKAEEQYRSIFNNAVDGIFRTSPDGKFLVANLAAARIFGFTSPEELIEERRDIAQEGYVDPRRRDEFKRLLQEQGVVNGFEYEAYRKDGSRVWISENTCAVHSPSGEILYFEGIFEDVTDRKRTEAALRESEERFRTIFEQAPLGISEGEIATARLINANQRYVDILGYTIDELGKLTFKDYSHPEDLQKDLVLFQKLAAGDIRTYAMEKRYLRKDGAIIWVNLTVSSLARPGEKPLNCIVVIDDITDRIQAEAALAAQAIRYKTLMETSTDSIYVLDADGNLQEANAAFLSRRGYTAAEVKGLKVADWDAQGSREQLQERLRKLVGSSAVFETRHRCKDGFVFDVEVCATSVRIGGEQLFFCVTRDITERKKAEFALRQLAQVSAASSDYIALIGRDFRYQFMNDTYLKARGLHLDDMIGRHMKEIVGQERFEQLGRPQVEACLRGEEVESFEWTDFRSDFRCFLHVKVSPLRELDGTISGAVMSGRDITGRHEAEQAQRESEERFRALYNDVPSMYFTLNATGIVLSVNEFGAAYLGYAPNELIGQPVHGIFVEEDRAMAREHVAESLANPSRTFDWELRKTRKDGRIVWVRETARAVRGRDGELAVLINCEDITERKAAAKELEEANHQLRFLSRRLFHLQEEERRHLARELHDEIGQALTAAKINLQSVTANGNGTTSARVQETVAILDRLLGQVRQISLDLRPSMLDDLGLVPALRSLLDQQGRRASVAVRFSAENMPEKLDPEIQTTCFRIVQEAITNAVRHARATRVDVDLRCKNGELRVLVRDNGIGFDVEATRAQAAGLGLIGIKERAALLSGSAKITSSQNQGTTIEVSLPLQSKR